MSKYLIIEKKKLQNKTIKISGYRHSSNLLLASAAILSNVSFKFYNMPDVLDTQLMLEILTGLGATCSHDTTSDTVLINTKKLFAHEIPNALSEQIHGSIYLMPALLARFGKCVFGKSGGCQIGGKDQRFERPVEHILDVMKKFGAEIHQTGETISSFADRLSPITINIMDYSQSKDTKIGPLTSGATKVAILLALSIKKGKTVILNPFLKSESIDLLNFAKLLGYQISYNVEKIEIAYKEITSTIEHAEYNVISDPSEIMTYITIAGYHAIQLRLTGITIERTWPILEPELKLLQQIGIRYKIESNNIIIISDNVIKATNIEITPTGVCTDHHPLLVALMLKANNNSQITEYVWQERFNYVSEANKFGLKLLQNKNKIMITPSKLQPAHGVVNCPDLRAAALLLILALGAPGITILKNHHHLNRGYVNFIENLQNMGASIKSVNKINYKELS